MQEIYRDEERVCRLANLERPFELRSPFEGEEYALLLLVFGDGVTPEEQGAISDAIVATGCRYAVCWGHACSSWDDSIDMSHLETDPNLAPPDESFVMTTWHEGESVEEVAWNLVEMTCFDDFVPTRFLVTCLGADEGKLGYVAAVVRDAFLDEDDDEE